MITGRKEILITVVAALALSGATLAKEIREVSWDDLLPEQPEPVSPLQLPTGETKPWDMETDSFEDAFATPAYPMGIVKELDGQRIKIPGFLLPLELIENGTVREFLLVPSFGACVHYPAPPPNQIVYVKLKEPIKIKSMWDPVWVSGEMRTQSQETDLASAGYTMIGELVEDYEY